MEHALEQFVEIADRFGVAVAVLTFLLVALVCLTWWMGRQFEWFKAEVVKPTVRKHLATMDSVAGDVGRLKSGQEAHQRSLDKLCDVQEQQALLLGEHRDGLNEIKERLDRIPPF